MSESASTDQIVATPSAATAATVGKDTSGKFAKGNKLGRGNPLAGRAAKIRAVLLRKLTPQRVERVAEQLIAKAETGDLAYIRELLDRTIGKAHQELTHHVDNQLALTNQAERDAENARLLEDMRAALASNRNGESA